MKDYVAVRETCAVQGKPQDVASRKKMFKDTFFTLPGATWCLLKEQVDKVALRRGFKQDSIFSFHVLLITMGETE